MKIKSIAPALSDTSGKSLISPSSFHGESLFSDDRKGSGGYQSAVYRYTFPPKSVTTRLFPEIAGVENKGAPILCFHISLPV